MAKKYIIGIDEVGRGPLAGPVTVAAVIAATVFYKNQRFFSGIKDSKKLSPEKREEWFRKFTAHSKKDAEFKFVHASVAAEWIDKIGISAALRLAVKKCLQKLDVKNLKQKIMLDGSLYAPKEYTNQETIIKGDEKVPIIAAASIVGKVIRDRMMIRLHNKFPEYGFDAHKGYGTRMHQAAIKRYGLSSIHRKTFCRKILSLSKDRKFI